MPVSSVKTCWRRWIRWIWIHWLVLNGNYIAIFPVIVSWMTWIHWRIKFKFKFKSSYHKRVWLNTAKDHKGPQRTITNTANDRWGQQGSAKNRKGPQTTANDHKGPQRTTNDRWGQQGKNHKGPLGTARVCKELHRILKWLSFWLVS